MTCASKTSAASSTMMIEGERARIKFWYLAAAVVVIPTVIDERERG
jgi:hypothetical protein